jgi:polyisoprenyl-phosphate glycosyltransferase
MKEKLSIIIPFLNEAENLNHLVSSLNSYFNSDFGYIPEVIFVNDGSTDTSVELLKKASHNYYACKIISLSKNYGSHAALRAGISQASGDYITFMYADLQDPLTLMDELYTQCLKGFDIVWATRKSTENNFGEKVFSTTYSSLMRRYAVPTYPEKGFDIVMFTKKVAVQINQNIEANSSIFLQILTLGFKQSTIYYKKENRKRGKSKWTFAKKIKLFIDSFIAFSYFPIRLVTFVGLLFFIIGILWSCYIIFRKLLYNDLEAGWPALISILMVGFGITNISLGIIAEYLWRTLDTARKRPVFIIDEITELGTGK